VITGTQAPQFPNERRPERAEAEQWEKVERFARFYSWLTLGAVLFGVAVAHKVLFTGESWTTCGDDPYCTLAFHLHEVPFIAFITWVAIYGLVRLTRATAHRYDALVAFANVVQLVFALFEILLLLDSLRREAPVAESVLLALVAAVLLVGAGLGLALRFRVDGYLHPPFDPRFEHPGSERELVALVKRAYAEGRTLRVRGAEHSVNAAIYADEGQGAINVQLDRYTQIVRWDPARMRVTVQAGCHLGIDPNNPGSTSKNSLLWQLERRGWALPDLGGITHQTVSGFLSTGSMGGTTQYDVGESVVGIRLIDGTGKIHDLAPNPDAADDDQVNPFYAAGVSMGLLGVISEVTFQCVPRYDIIGSQDTTTTEGCAISLFEPGDTGLAAFFGRTPYSRLLWWPQHQVDKMQVWQARRTVPSDEPNTHEDGRFEPKPFVSLPGGDAAQALVNGFYELVSHDRPPYEHATASFVRSVLNTLLPNESVRFWDYWLTGLPMDNQISDTFMPTEFTELFIDIRKSHEVMRVLRDFYSSDAGMERTGPYACEIYPAKRSRFWLSPSYGIDTIRVDVFWFKTAIGSPELEFYPQYWELFMPFDFRFHWGKYLSDPKSSTGSAYIRRQFPMWDKFMALREQLDPRGVFLTAYWREHLGIGLEQVRVAKRRGAAVRA
jgi:D-arabinono-1,4-lactone oxidase